MSKTINRSLIFIIIIILYQTILFSFPINIFVIHFLTCSYCNSNSNIFEGIFLEYFEYVNNFHYYKNKLIQNYNAYINNNNNVESKENKKIIKKKPKYFTFELNKDQKENKNQIENKDKNKDKKEKKIKVTYLDNFNPHIDLKL